MKKNIGRRIKNLVSKCGTNNPVEICKILGIKVFYLDLGKSRKGFFKRYKGINYIVINSNLSEFLQLLVLLHELGHIVLKHSTKNITFMKDYYFGFSNKLENEANLFVAEYLVLTIDMIGTITKEEEKILNRIMSLRIK